MKVIVIGGGASGMMSAISAAHRGHEVTLLERNEKLGKKIYITGKGRCNLTNASDMETVRGQVVSNPRFLYSAFAAFDNRDIVSLLEAEGCHTRVERGNRVFPATDHASDVTKALQERLVREGVTIRLNSRVTGLVCEEGCCTGVCLENGRKMKADAVIVATGGRSYPSTGSTGDGYRFAEETGHRVIPLRPSLVPFETKETWPRMLQGLSLKNVNVSVRKKGRALFSEMGEMLFTHFGVSGPAVLSASAVMGGDLPANLIIDLKPALSPEQLDERIRRDFEAYPNRQLDNVLRKLYPASLVPVMITLCGLDPSKPVRQVTREERGRIAERTKALTMTLTALRGFEEAIVTHGGVCVQDVSPSTLESKKVKGLYFAGEVLDVDAMTGGYNLQIAWSTGWLAGRLGEKED